MQEIEIRCAPARSGARNPPIDKVGTIRCWAAPVVDDVVECEGLLYTVTSRSWVDRGPDPRGKRLVLTCTKVGE